MTDPVTHVYVPCDSAAVSVGADEVAAAIRHEARRRNLHVNLIRNGSRGVFWLEPLVEVEADGGRIAYGPVTAVDVFSLFEADFLRGGRHSLYHGRTEDIPWLRKQERLTFARCGITDPLSLADYQAHEGLLGLERALTLSPDDIIREITESGLRGRGGAGFPTGIKWKTVREAASNQKYICCNADEGDSGTFADRMLMEGDPFCIIEGMTIAGLAVGATEGLIYTRSEYPDAIRTMKSAVKRAEDAGWLGVNIHGSNKSFHISVRTGAGAYICGEETAMLESLEGKRGMIRVKPPLPALSGLFGKPTVVNNVLSLTAVPAILAKGGAWYRDFGVGHSRGSKPFQLAGNIKRGGLVEKAFGLTLRELIEDFGGGTLTDRPVRAVQVGGPLGAYIPAAQLDTPLGYEEMAAIGGMLGHGGVVVFDDTVNMARQARFAMQFCAEESCGKCTPCRIGSTRGAEVIDKLIVGEERKKNHVLLQDLCEVMEKGSLCAMGGLTPLPVRSALSHFPEDFGLPKEASAS